MQQESRAIKLNYLREHNIRLIMSLLYVKPMSCLELSKEIGISDVGARKIVKQLEAYDMVKVAPETDSSRKRGNQHIRYALNAELGYFLIFNNSFFDDKFILFDFSGKRVYESPFTLPERDVTRADLEELARETKQKLIDHGIDIKKIINVTLSVSGQIDDAARCFTISGRFNAFENDTTGSFFRIFEDAFSVPVYAKNDVMLMLLGETDNNPNIAKTFLYMFVGYGISSAIMYKGEIVTGVRGYAGEIGGNRFGTDSTVSLNASLYRLRIKCRQYLETQDLQGFIKAYNERKEVEEVIQHSALVVGMEIANIANLLGIETVFMSGEALLFGEKYINAVQAAAQKYSIPNVQVHMSVDKDLAVRGALSQARVKAIETIMSRPPSEK